MPPKLTEEDMMTTKYAAQDHLQIFSDHEGVHKAGRVPLNTPLYVIRTYDNCYQIERPVPLYSGMGTEPAVVDANYPNYWVPVAQALDVPVEVPQDAPGDTPEAPGAPITAQDALAFVKVLRYVLGH